MSTDPWEMVADPSESEEHTFGTAALKGSVMEMNSFGVRFSDLFVPRTTI
jgi:hypothetical protein